MLCKLSLVALIGLNSILPVGISKPHPNTAISSSPAVISDVNKVTPRYSYQSSKTWNTAYGSITTKIQVDADTGYIQSGWVEFPNSSYIFHIRNRFLRINIHVISQYTLQIPAIRLLTR